MTAIDVSGQFVQKIALIGDAYLSKVPKVVMGVANGEVWFQSRFLS
jgi:hypothetical protein